MWKSDVPFEHSDKRRRINWLPAIVPAVVCVLASAATAAPATVSLPYTVQDSAGYQWRLYQYGQLQQSGNMPIYSQGAMLYVNGNQASSNVRTAAIDEKTGEIVLENLNANGLIVTRRVLFDKEEGTVRYIDIFKNPTGQPINANIMLQTSMNYGVTSSENVIDPRKKGQNFAWVAQTSGNGAVMEVFAGKNAKTPMTITHQQGNSVVAANLQVEVKPNQQVALMHVHGIRPTQDAAKQHAVQLKDAELFKNVPPDLRKIILNFSGGSNFIGEVELLRGDLLDVIELRGGDQLKGTLREETYELTTFYGPVTLPVDKVVAMLNVGSFRPRQLMVTVDGQIFGGALKQETLSLQLSSGQVTKIPLSQISRMGYRKRSGEPEEWTFEKPIVLMRTGERVGVKMPATPLEFVTRYGPLTLQPQQIGSVVLQSEEAGIHRMLLTDGSRFSGLLSTDVLEMELDAGNGPAQTVKFPASSIARVQLNAKVVEPDEMSPTLALANEDLLVGTIDGAMKIDTAFDTIAINAAEVRELKRSPGGGLDVQVTLFDGSSLSGQLQEMSLNVSLNAGLKMSVPLALLEVYTQPQPTPGKEMEEKIIGLIKELSSDDWKVRDRAQQNLVAVGTVAISSLARLRDGQPPEAQQRIDSILKELEKQRAKPAQSGRPAAADPSAPASGPIPPPRLLPAPR